MKDTIITARAKRREYFILMMCFAVANIINVVCIIVYGTRWIELLSQLGYVVVITATLYCLVWVVRFIVGLFYRKRA